MNTRPITLGNIFLLPFSLLYRLVIGIRNTFFEWGILPSTEFGLPVISVGNITVGGTGKTPHVEYLIDLLKNEYLVATLSRGYGRETSKFIIADMDSSASQVGDEPRQIKQKYPGIIVAVDRRRVNGIRRLLNMKEHVDVILLDDAFQHRYVKPGKSILLMDYKYLVTRDFLLPAGRLREPASAKKRADIILITKTPGRLKPMDLRNIVMELGIELHQHLFFTRVDYGELKPVFDIPEDKKGKLKSRKTPLLLLTGIANPRPLRKYARSISTNLHEITFPDHHKYDQKDIEKIRNKIESMDHPDTIILTTEKDAMRLQEINIEDSLKNILYYVPIKVSFLNDDQHEFNKLILNYVRSNKRDNLLHKRANNTKS